MVVRKFETQRKSFTIYDVTDNYSPYIHLIRGLSYADAAILFIDATKIVERIDNSKHDNLGMNEHLLYFTMALGIN